MHQKTQNHFLKFSIHLFVRESQENYRQINGKSKASLWRNLSYAQVRPPPPNFLGQCFALQLQFTSHIFFRKAVMRKLFNIRFSYKHCNFSRICLLVKMASKTVTRSILQCMVILIWFGKIILLLDVQHVTFNKNIYGINNINH